MHDPGPCPPPLATPGPHSLWPYSCLLRPAAQAERPGPSLGSRLSFSLPTLDHQDVSGSLFTVYPESYRFRPHLWLPPGSTGPSALTWLPEGLPASTLAPWLGFLHAAAKGGTCDICGQITILLCSKAPRWACPSPSSESKLHPMLALEACTICPSPLSALPFTLTLHTSLLAVAETCRHPPA